MLITYLRSSSWNNFDSCQQQYYLHYVLGLENNSGRAASKGNVVHKVLECLAAQKLCIQNGTTSFVDDNLGLVDINDCDVDHLVRLSYDWHKANYTHHKWDDKVDFNDCVEWTHMPLNFQNGLFDPRKRNVVCPEQKFDFEIKEDWAKYHYELPDGKILDGYLGLKGTVDLITKVRDNMYEMIDWKTGATRNDFVTGKEKNYESLHMDNQLRLYHYAAHRIFPEIDDILMTIYFVRAGGPFSLMLSKDDLPETEEMIRRQFEKVKNTIRPSLNPGPYWSSHYDAKNSHFKCKILCAFAQPSVHDPRKTECQFIRDEVVKNGIDATTNKFGDLKKINIYTGGGRINVDDSKKEE